MSGKIDPIKLSNKHYTSNDPLIIKAEKPNGAWISNRKKEAIELDLCSFIYFENLLVEDSIRGFSVVDCKNIKISSCTARRNQVEGIKTGFSDFLELRKNICLDNGTGNDDYEPGKGHGIYVSCSADTPVIIDNTCRNNKGCGIQLNGNPRERSVTGEMVGIVDKPRVQGNYLEGNGGGGAAGMNIMSTRNGQFIENILKGNIAGYAFYDDYAGEKWGSKDNLIQGGEVSTGKRYGFQFLNGSTGNKIENLTIHVEQGPAFHDEEKLFKSKLAPKLHNVVIKKAGETEIKICPTCKRPL